VVVISVLEREETRPSDYATLEAHGRELSRGVLSIICRSTGRPRTLDECARLDELVLEIDRVRGELREARVTH
jgi:hypothetical protein